MGKAERNDLGELLKLWRRRMNPGFPGATLSRRRTPGLRREEVAERARVSSTWYTWLEQGRGGAPSPEALDRIAGVLRLTRAEREHLFLMAQLYAPQPRYEPSRSATPRMQQVLDTLATSPAYIRTAAYDLIAWNKAATVVLADYGLLAREQRNLLTRLFCEKTVRDKMPETWESHARFEVANFRAEAMRHGNSGRIEEVIEQLCQKSEEFRTMWEEHEVSDQTEGTKRIVHEKAGPLTLEYSAFSVINRPDLTMVVYVPSTVQEVQAVCELLGGKQYCV